MQKPEIRFYFNYAGDCLRGNDISMADLAISKELLSELETVMDLYNSRVDWNTGESLWTKEQIKSFLDKTDVAFEKLKEELESEYELINLVRGDFPGF